jgi:hypothetical protein
MDKRLAITTALLLLAPLLAGADTGWVTSAPDNAGFSAEFPVPPSPQVQPGQGYTTSMWIAKSADENVLVLTGVTDYWADIDTEQELVLDQKNFLSSVGGTASSSKRDTYPGSKRKTQLPSVVFDFSTTSGWNGRSRVIKDGNTVYQTAVMWRQGYDASAALELFEKTFKLLPRKRPSPPAATAAPAAGG